MTPVRALAALALTALAVTVPLAEANHGAPQLVTPGTAQDVFTTSVTIDGSRIFFHTFEKLSDADDDSAQDVYQRVLATGVTTLVSDGDPAALVDPELDAQFAGASADGSRFFIQTAEPLLAGDDDTAKDVYERFGGTTTLVTDRIKDTGDQNLDVFGAGVSRDGSRYFFITIESLVTADGDSSQDVYLRAGGTTTLVSDRVQAGPDAALGAGVGGGGMSDDGSRILFTTQEQIVDADDDAASTDLYLYDVPSGMTTLVSDRVQDAADEAKVVNSTFGMTRDGSRVYFVTPEALLAQDTDSEDDDVYEFTVAGGATTMISDHPTPGSDGDYDAALTASITRPASDDGSHVIFVTNESLVADDTDGSLCVANTGCFDVYDRSGGTTTLLSDKPGGPDPDASQQAFPHAVSADGARVVFVTFEPLLPAEDADAVQDVYMRESGVTTLLSDRIQPGADAGATVSTAVANKDVTRVFFRSLEQIVDADDDSSADYYERSGGVTTLLTDRVQPGPDQEPSTLNSTVHSEDGLQVIFTINEPLVSDDGDALLDAYWASAGPPPGASSPADAVNDAATVAEDAAATTVDVRANDTDADATKDLVTGKTNGAHGAVAITNGGADVSYTPDANYCGADSFTYTLSGGDTATVAVTVTCVDDPAVAIDDALAVAEDAAATTVDVRANDTDADATKDLVTAKTNGAHGSVAITNGGADVSYAPAADYCGADSFTYTLSGGDTATVAVTVTCVDDPAPPLTPPDLPGLTPPGPLSACTPSTGFKTVSVKPARRGLRFKIALSKKRRFTAEVFQRSQGRNIKTRRVARIVRKAGKARHTFTWNGRRAKSDGFYVARLAMKLPGRPDIRQLVFQRRARKFAARPAHTLRDTCTVLRAFRLSSPVFGGKKGRALEISYVLGGASDVEISVRRGATVVLAIAKARRPGGQNLKLPLVAKGLKRGLHKVTIRVTRGAQVTTGTITARLL